MLFGKKTIGTIAYMGGVFALPEPFVWSWTQMIQFNNDYLVEPNERIEYTRATVSYHAFARNMLVKVMQGDWLLMFDVDHQFEPDLPARMLARLNKYDIDVLIGAYLYKSDPHPPVMYGYNKKKDLKYVIGDWSKEADIIPLHSAGAGCLFVRKKVFDRIQEELKEEPFDIIPPFSEDHSFFERLYKLGIQPYFSPNIEANHLTFKALSIEKDYVRKNFKVRKEGTVQGYK